MENANAENISSLTNHLVKQANDLNNEINDLMNLAAQKKLQLEQMKIENIKESNNILDNQLNPSKKIKKKDLLYYNYLSYFYTSDNEFGNNVVKFFLKDKIDCKYEYKRILSKNILEISLKNNVKVTFNITTEKLPNNVFNIHLMKVLDK